MQGFGLAKFGLAGVGQQQEQANDGLQQNKWSELIYMQGFGLASLVWLV